MKDTKNDERAKGLDSKKRSKKIEFSEAEKRKIIEEMIDRDFTKREIWEEYTGRKTEHGRIIVWMRELGYIGGDELKNKNIFYIVINNCH